MMLWTTNEFGPERHEYQPEASQTVFA